VNGSARVDRRGGTGALRRRPLGPPWSRRRRPVSAGGHDNAAGQLDVAVALSVAIRPIGTGICRTDPNAGMSHPWRQNRPLARRVSSTTSDPRRHRAMPQRLATPPVCVQGGISGASSFWTHTSSRGSENAGWLRPMWRHRDAPHRDTDDNVRDSAGGGIRTPTLFRTRTPKDRASAISPRPQRQRWYQSSSGATGPRGDNRAPRCIGRAPGQRGTVVRCPLRGVGGRRSSCW
jgi:hypothetical protein